MAHNVPVVYDVFAVAIKEREAFQQPQKCAGVSRGRQSRPRRTEAKPRRGAAYTILLCAVCPFLYIFFLIHYYFNLFFYSCIIIFFGVF